MEMEDTKTLAGIIARANSVMAMSKKLTTKDRKKLPDSVYCGPGRSFPCPDCSHVVAAKALLGRSKFSDSTKKKIAACINRKAKKLGCSTEKKAKAGRDYLIYSELSYEQKQLYSSDVFKTTRDLVEQSLKAPGADLSFVDIVL
jgi:hypothetical protein